MQVSFRTSATLSLVSMQSASEYAWTHCTQTIHYAQQLPTTTRARRHSSQVLTSRFTSRFTSQSSTGSDSPCHSSVFVACSLASSLALAHLPDSHQLARVAYTSFRARRASHSLTHTLACCDFWRPLQPHIFSLPHRGRFPFRGGASVLQSSNTIYCSLLLLCLFPRVHTSSSDELVAI